MTPKQLSKLTKAQLIEHIGQLEKETVSCKLDHLVSESRLLFKDLAFATRYVFELGVKTRKLVDSFSLSILQPQEEVPDGCTLIKGSLYEFNY